jgi:hypothetical protein
MHSFYSLIDYDFDTMKVIENINARDVYESVIMRCISYGNVVMLGEVLKNEKLEVFKKLLKIDNKIKIILVDCAIKNGNIDIVKIMFGIYEMDYVNEYDELIKNGDLVYNNYQLINKKKDVDYIIDNFEELTGEPLLVYDECVNAMEKYMNEKLSEEDKQYLSEVVSRMQEQMYNVRQEMTDMDNRMYDEWYNWRTDANYHSYDSYKIEMQIDIWDEFKEYYESIEVDDSEKEREEDYDY